MTNRTQLLDQVQSMEDQAVKALVLEWLSGTDGSLDDFGRLMGDTNDLTYGQINHQGEFQPLTEAAMAAQSLQTLEAYKRNRDGISHDRVSQWLDRVDHPEAHDCVDVVYTKS
ncbi:MAG: hypothetical protein HC795_17760 [Coleofasciculaceae cyanobacterium RL_1_1]|nr:hypothetical protein [Coleofasciculaceae cyanobacterium RL_1_1]